MLSAVITVHVFSLSGLTGLFFLLASWLRGEGTTTSAFQHF